MNDRDGYETETGIEKEYESEKKEERRKTVTVINGTGRALIIRQHDAAVHPHAPRMPNGDVAMTLQTGGNHGVDKEWFDAWLKDNAGLSLVTLGEISAVDEPDDLQLETKPEHPAV